MASGQSEEFSVKAGQNVGQAQVKRDDCKVDNNTNSSQTSGFLQQKGEKVKSMAQGASEVVKNKLEMNNDNDNDCKNQNTSDRKSPNNTTCPSMPGHPPSDF
ncbi:F97 [Hirschfeldia incana]|nr:F97 [Hirschfeldia incana]